MELLKAQFLISPCFEVLTTGSYPLRYRHVDSFPTKELHMETRRKSSSTIHDATKKYRRCISSYSTPAMSYYRSESLGFSITMSVYEIR
jgi:hypothetical protein